MTKVFVNGKEVEKEDLGKIEIVSENVKAIFSRKIKGGGTADGGNQGIWGSASSTTVLCG